MRNLPDIKQARIDAAVLRHVKVERFTWDVLGVVGEETILFSYSKLIIWSLTEGAPPPTPKIFLQHFPDN